METLDLADEVRTAAERIGSAELVVGLATAGPSATVAAVAGAVRAGLDAHFAGQAAVVVPRGPGSVRGDAGRAGRRPGSGAGDPRDGGRPRRDDALDWAQAVRTTLTVGRRLEARAIVMLNADLGSTTASGSAAWPPRS